MSRRFIKKDPLGSGVCSRYIQWDWIQLTKDLKLRQDILYGSL